MKNQTSIDTLDDIVGKQAAASVYQELNLRSVRVFDFARGVRIAWTNLCFVIAVILLRQSDTGIYGGFFALLFVYALLGSPVRYELDTQSQKRLDAWVDEQRNA